jgi:hypothetical protein
VNLYFCIDQCQTISDKSFRYSTSGQQSRENGEGMKITVLAGGMSLVAMDIASAKKLINEQLGDSQKVSFTVELCDETTRKRAEDELNAEMAKWRPKAESANQNASSSSGVAQSQPTQMESLPAPATSAGGKHKTVRAKGKEK